MGFEQGRAWSHPCFRKTPLDAKWRVAGEVRQGSGTAETRLMGGGVDQAGEEEFGPWLYRRRGWKRGLQVTEYKKQGVKENGTNQVCSLSY